MEILRHANYFRFDVVYFPSLCNSAGDTPLSICLRQDAMNASQEMQGNLFRVRPEGGIDGNENRTVHSDRL